METKLIAAEIATAAGVTTSICSSQNPKNVCGIIEYHNTRLGKAPESSRKTERPPHTVFTPAANPVRDLKSWVSHTLHPAGSVVIDAGAYRVLSKRTSGGRLLPAGVIGAFGDFSSGQAVRICVKIAKASQEEEEFQRNAYNQHRQVAKSNLPLSEPASGVDTPHEVEEEQHSPVELTEDDVVEVGRGLANYNNSQISRLKGLNRCVLLCCLACPFLMSPLLSAHICPESLATLIRNMSSKTLLSLCPPILLSLRRFLARLLALPEQQAIRSKLPMYWYHFRGSIDPCTH